MFEDFLSSLLAFESGWDRDRYDSGVIQDWQLDSWAGGPVQLFYPQYSSWGDLSAAEWETMAYKSMNSLGFVGFQFGEALLIDLGYYDATTFYGNGASTNTWAGTWTGKNGVNSLEDFMTKDAQQVAIREAFGYNLSILEQQLSNSGQSLSDFIGQTASYSQNGETVSVELTLTGILAAAHLRGAWGTATLLQNGAVSQDEYGTSILQYVEQFGGFEAPGIDELIAYYTDRLTGDEGLGTPGDGGTPGTGNPDGGTPGGNGDADVSEQTADVVITWAWGQDAVIQNFDPATGTIFIDWIGAADISVTETAAGVVFSVPSNNQTTTLAGVSLNDLSAANFTILDAGTAQEVLALVGSGSTPGTPDAPDQPDTPDTPDTPDNPGTPGDTDTPDTSEPTDPPPTVSGSLNGDANVTLASATVGITWAWGQNQVVSNFDPQTDTIFIDWFSPSAIDVAEVGGNLVFTMAGNNQTVTIEGVSLSELSSANFTIRDQNTGQEILSQLGGTAGPVTPDPEPPVDPEPPIGPGTPDDPAQMIMIMPNSPSRTINDFDVSKDMIHLEAGVIAERVDITDTPDGLTVSLFSSVGQLTSQTVLTGVALSDLTMSNFMVAEQSTLNEVAGLLGQVISTPGTGNGFDVVYDNDGSSPPITDVSDLGGVKFAANFGADDIIGFNPATDEIDFGNASVHGLILTMTPTGEPVIDNPWGPDMQILQGVQLSELSIENFGVVGNEHLRQDLGGILSWEKGIGPRDADTVYVRSHEYGQGEVIGNFDPATQKISFLYFGTRERLSVEDTPDGMVISSLPSGQSFTFTGVSKADLVPGNLEFHFDQVMEDNLEAAFGIDQNAVSLVSREGLLTPEAPVGQSTDGFQVRDLTSDGSGAPAPDTGTPDTGTPGPDMPDPDTGTPTPPPSAGNGSTISLGDGADTVAITWDWGALVNVAGFNPQEDILDFGSLGQENVQISEDGLDLVISVLNNGGHAYRVEGVQAEDLSLENLEAASWNGVVNVTGGIADQLADLGNPNLIV